MAKERECDHEDCGSTCGYGACGDCPECGSLSPNRCGCNDEEDDDAELEPVKCPKCGSEDVKWQEQVWVERPVLGVDADGVVYVSEAESMCDDGSVDQSETLFCSGCDHTFDLGGGVLLRR